MRSEEFLTRLYWTPYTIRVFKTRRIRLRLRGPDGRILPPLLGEEVIATGVCAFRRKLVSSRPSIHAIGP